MIDLRKERRSTAGMAYFPRKKKKENGISELKYFVPRKESEKQKRGQNTDKSPSEFFPPKISIIIMKKERKEGKKDVNLKHFQCGLAHRMHTHTHTHTIYTSLRGVFQRERESQLCILDSLFSFFAS